MKHKNKQGRHAPISLGMLFLLWLMHLGAQAQPRLQADDNRIQQTLATSANAGSTIKHEHAAFMQVALGSNEFSMPLSQASGSIYVITNGHEIKGLGDIYAHGRPVVFADKYDVLSASPDTYFVITSFYGNSSVAMLSLALHCNSQSARPNTIEGEWKAEVRNGKWHVVSHQSYKQ